MPNRYEAQLLILLSRALFEKDAHAPFAREDYRELIRESILHSVAPLALDGLESSDDVPPELLAAWRKYVFSAYRANCRVFADHAKLHRWMRELEIPYCVLKGVASAAYYPKPDLRMMGDVDFYVSDADLPRALRFFEEQGFPTPTECNHHYGLEKDGSEFELHFALPGTPSGEMGERVCRYTENLMAEAKEVTDSFGTYVLPSDFHHGLIMLLHMQQHLASEGIGLRHLCDYAVFVNRFTDAEFKERFVPALYDLGLLFFAQIMARVAHRYLSLPYRPWMGEGDLSLEDRMMEEILDSGNFGQKDDTRKQAGFLIAHSRDGKRHGFFYRLFAGINTYLRGKYKLFRKAPFLLPLGWPIYFIRYSFLLISGKRKLKLTKIAKGTQKRDALYKELHLFE